MRKSRKKQKKWMIMLIVVVVSIMNPLSMIHSTAVEVGKIIYVDDDNTGGPWNGSIINPFQYIQDAIDNASHGDTIFVFNGNYSEQIRVNTTVKIIGENRDLTIVDGKKNKEVLTLLKNHIVIRNLTLMNCGTYGTDKLISICSNYNIIENNNLGVNSRACISLEKSYANKIIGNYIHDSMNGIKTPGYGSSSKNVIANNIFQDNFFGVSISGNRSWIINNKILDNEHGVNLQTSKDNIVSDNTFVNCGLVLNQIGDNIVSNNSVNGKSLIYLVNQSNKKIDYDAGQIILIHCSNISISGQYIANTDIGIQLLSSNNCSISNNVIETVSWQGIQLLKSNHNTISENIMQNCRDGIRLKTRSKNNIIWYNQIFSSNFVGINIYSGCNDNYVYNNHISSSYYSGISIDSNNNNISENIIWNNDRGIKAYGSNNRIIRNKVSNNNEGISLISSGSIISENEIKQNKDYGIILRSSNTNVLIQNNDISENNGTGIYISGSKNIISKNNIRKNNIGIFIFGKKNNVTYNNFKWNDKSAFVREYVWKKSQMYNKRNIWFKNYWERPHILPKLIMGAMIITENRYNFYEVPYVEFDFYPKKLPNIINPLSIFN